MKPAKRAKIDIGKHPYPAIAFSMDDEDSHTREMDLLKAELAKPKSDMDRAKQLMCRTFTRRRRWLLEEERPVADICTEYPFLRRLSIVSFL